MYPLTKEQIQEIRQNPNKVDWDDISYNQTLSEEFIREFKGVVNWLAISSNQILSEEFIREFKDKINWYYISRHQILSENFIKEFKDKIDWENISSKQVLSEDFITKFKNRIWWNDIATYQTLSEKFIRKFDNRISRYQVSKYQFLSEEFIKEFGLRISEENWLYKDKEFKLNYLKKIGVYDIIDDDYIIAYKSTRKNGKSIYDNRYLYEVGKEYKSRCDCNADSFNSFGLSGWTEQNAIYYYSYGKLFKIKINIDDLGCITDRFKIRSKKITILEEVDK